MDWFALNDPYEAQLRARRQAMLRAHADALAQSRSLYTGLTAGERITHTSLASPTQVATVKANVADLRPITLAEMTVGETHKGRVLLCKTLADPVIMSSCMTVVEDINGECERFAVYGIAKSNDLEDAKRVLPPNSIVAVKEPYLRRAGDGGRVVRVDNPENMRFLGGDHPLLRGTRFEATVGATASASGTGTCSGSKSTGKQVKAESKAADDPTNAEGWRTKGNTHFMNNEWQKAKDCYLRCLSFDREDVRAHGNLAQTCLKLQDYKGALFYADAALWFEPENSKCLFRRGSALMELQRYEEALQCFTHPKLADVADADTAATKARKKIQEAERSKR